MVDVDDIVIDAERIDAKASDLLRLAALLCGVEYVARVDP